MPPGSMNATFQTIDPGSQEVLATVCEMGEAEVARKKAVLDDAERELKQIDGKLDGFIVELLQR